MGSHVLLKIVSENQFSGNLWGRPIFIQFIPVLEVDDRGAVDGLGGAGVAGHLQHQPEVHHVLN